MRLIKEYKIGSLEWCKLNMFSEIVNKFMLEHKKAYHMTTRNYYYDFGANWKYTALITEDLGGNTSWQTLNARDYENILLCDSFKQIEEWALSYAEGLMAGHICQAITY